MKTKIITQLIAGLLIAALSSASLAADIKTAESDGVLQLPTFHVYASDSETKENELAVTSTAWTFQKSLNFQSDLDMITIVAPGNMTKTVSVPSIQTALVNTDMAEG